MEPEKTEELKSAAEPTAKAGKKAKRKAPAKAKAKPAKKAAPAKAAAKTKAAKPAKAAKATKRPKLAAKPTAKKAKPQKAAKAKPAAKPAPRKLAAPIVKNVIKSADAQALDILVANVKKNHLDAERRFEARLPEYPVAVRERAKQLLGELGMTPHAAGVLALNVAELEAKLARAKGRPVATAVEDLEDGEPVELDTAARTVRKARKPKKAKTLTTDDALHTAEEITPLDEPADTQDEPTPTAFLDYGGDATAPETTA